MRLVILTLGNKWVNTIILYNNISTLLTIFGIAVRSIAAVIVNAIIAFAFIRTTVFHNTIYNVLLNCEWTNNKSIEHRGLFKKASKL